jgi:hypothetical protein
MTVNNELGRMWKEVTVAYFKILFEHSPNETEENRENFIRTAEN